MNYFIKRGYVIEKYLVDFNVEELKNLREEIIFNCGEITHYSYESPTIPDGTDLRMKNYKVEKLDKKEEDELYKIKLDLFHIEYDYYEEPYLAILINRLLNGNVSVIEEILIPNYEKERLPYIDLFFTKIQEVSQEVRDIPDFDIERKKEKLDELIELVSKARLNNSQQLIGDYYDKVQKAIRLILVQKIDIDDLETIEDFFGVDISDIDTINKTRQRIKK